jgi:hypothetical protein
MPRLVSKTDKLKYGKNVYQYGEAFDASDRDAVLLKKIGRATDAPIQPKMINLPPQEAPAEPEAPLSSLYQRRDMRATDGLTGGVTQPLSSRRGRPRKEQISTSQEDDAEQ